MAGWRFSHSELRLVQGARSVQITPKAAAVLSYLLSRRGEIVGRDELLQQVWPGLHVTKDLVREYIHDLRNALEDDAKAPRFLETVRGRGFRLIGDIEAASDGETPAPPAAGSPDEVRATIAVLRPDASGTDASWALFAERLASDIVGTLARGSDIAVIAKALSFAIRAQGDLRQAAEDLGADYFLESTLTVHGDTVRVGFHLVDARSGCHVWADRFDDRAGNVLHLSDRIVSRVTNALIGWNGELHRAEYRQASMRPAARLNAFQHFIRACDLDPTLDTVGLGRALYHLDASLALDRRFARAWVIKSTLLGWIAQTQAERDPPMLRDAGEAIENAFMLDPVDPTTQGLVAMKRARDGDMASARELAARAASGCGSDADGCIAACTAAAVILGDTAQAMALLDRALVINPHPPAWYRLVETRVSFFDGAHLRSIRASKGRAAHVSALAFRALSEASLDRSPAAAASLGALRTTFPEFDFDNYPHHLPIAHPLARSRWWKAVSRLQRITAEEDRAV